MTEHTPGPWLAERHGAVTAEVNGRRRQVAAFVGDAAMHGDATVDADAIRDANARVGAAAPAMLEALEALVYWHRQPYDRHIDESWWQAAEEAVYAARHGATP